MILTVFTPAYNRGYCLSRLYQSLQDQTNKNFQWLIVDDGSTDDTESLVKVWQEENSLSIRYIKQENAGKMKAHNTGVLATETEAFVCIDSDDWLVKDAVEKILVAWEKEEISKREKICGIVAYRGKEDEVTPLGTHFPVGVEKSTLSGLYAQGFEGDSTLILKTEVLKKYLFPIINGEKFITEAYVYDQIDQTYAYCVLPTVITVCKYLEDGLTNNLGKLLFKNPCGYVAYAMQQGNFAKSLKGKFSAYIRANCFRHKTKGVEMPVKPKNKFLYNLAYPFGVLLYFNKKRRYKKGLKKEKANE